MQPELMGISKNKKGHFLDLCREMVSTEGTLTLSFPRSSIDDLVFSVFTSNFLN